MKEIEYNRKAVYEYALLKGKRIIIVSDMFLPKSFIERILVKNGYDKYEKLYLSSEYKKIKFTGSLFKIVLAELEVKPSQILHVTINIVITKHQKN